MKALLALEDGSTFSGELFGAEGETTGEVVFNTGMSGYQEILTDPSYHGQIVVMTSPLIGNTGVNSEDGESDKIHAAGFVVREPSRITSSFRSEKPLGDYLKEQGVVGISGIDTRTLTRRIRTSGSMRCVISSVCTEPDELVRRAKNAPSITGRNLAAEVTCKKTTDFTGTLWRLGKGFDKATNSPSFHIAVIDLGIKRNILRHLCERDCRVTIFPASATAREVMAVNPDGLFLSNGPGDPAPVESAKQLVQNLMGKIPIFGICLGHQILCLSMGAKTFKMKFGHHGINHPVMNMLTGNVVSITSQNHGFAVERESLPNELELTHYSLNDQTVEGVRHRKHPAFSVQYHPEAAPGPQDTTGHFDEFIALMKANRN